VTATDRDHLGTLRAIMSEWLRAIIGIRRQEHGTLALVVRAEVNDAVAFDIALGETIECARPAKHLLLLMQPCDIRDILQTSATSSATWALNHA
jgi:hypothetical protein